MTLNNNQLTTYCQIQKGSTEEISRSFRLHLGTFYTLHLRFSWPKKRKLFLLLLSKMEMWQNEACYRKFHSIFHFKLPLFEISSIMSWKVNQVHGVWHCVLGTWEWEQAKKWLCWIKSHSQYCAFHLNNGSLKSRLTPHLCSNFALGQPDCICLNQNFVIWPSKANIGNKSWSWGKSIFVWVCCGNSFVAKFESVARCFLTQALLQDRWNIFSW